MIPQPQRQQIWKRRLLLVLGLAFVHVHYQRIMVQTALNFASYASFVSDSPLEKEGKLSNKATESSRDQHLHQEHEKSVEPNRESSSATEKPKESPSEPKKPPTTAETPNDESPQEPENSPQSNEKQRLETTTNEGKRSIGNAPISPVSALAPWDPVWQPGGAERVLQPCQREIEILCKEKQDQYTHLPILSCLFQHLGHKQGRPANKTITKKDLNNTVIGPSCFDVLYPCYEENGGDKTNQMSCRTTKELQPRVPALAHHQMVQVLDKIDQLATTAGIQYWLTAGSSVGALLHHGRIPWDDDIDIYVLQEDIPSFLNAVRDHGLIDFESTRNSVWKIYDPENSKPIKRLKWSWPSIDLFPVNCDDEKCVEQPLMKRTEPHIYPKDNIFPLRRRPFGQLSLPFPARLADVVFDRYGPNVAKLCMKGGFDHSVDKFRRKDIVRVNCTDMHFYPAFVDVFSNATNPGQRMHQPWYKDDPNFTVEHLMDGPHRLSSVTFYQGAEMKRSYADGLAEVQDQKITFTVPKGSREEEVLTPFLLEERQSYARNLAKRSAKELNEEVMPMVNRVQVSNKYQYNNAPTTSIKVAFWNAERGTSWDVFREFIPDADIIILNEMDWGMARSGNIHSTVSLSNQLQMNYAYGVEFIELTNGNAGEINATLGQTNLVGYHGNVILSKWPIEESTTKIIRLHELYDHLFKNKTKGQDQGERRLGGRMALFAVTSLPTGENILGVSIHSHGGAKTVLLKRDANAICSEIKNFTSSYNISMVFAGGDMARVVAKELSASCGMLDLRETNDFKPTWRVDCPNGEKPRARFERGDWLIAGGSSIHKVRPESRKTIHPYVMTDDDKYKCISDHSMIELVADLSIPVAATQS